MSKVKTKWIKPQLIVLTRGRPEESVLLHCKTNNPAGNPVGQWGEQMQADCAYVDTKLNCQNCQSRAMGT